MSQCNDQVQSMDPKHHPSNSTVRKPASLRPGDTIAFLSPSDRLTSLFPQRIVRARSYFEQKGYRTLVINTGDDATARSSSTSAQIQARVEEVHSAFRDDEIKAIICVIGGSSANQLLPYLDYGLIARKHDKIFVGYSDITILHHALFVKSGVRGFYGPAVLPCFGESPAPLRFTADAFWDVVCSTDPVASSSAWRPRTQIEMHEGLVRRRFARSEGFSQEFLDWSHPGTDMQPRTLVPVPSRRWLRRGQRVTGRLFGGCLPSLIRVIGTPYCPPDMYSGRILFVETPEHGAPDLPFPVGMAQTAMYDLVNAGLLGQIVGLVVGRPYMYDDGMREEFEQMLLDVTEGFEGPVLVNADIGHTHPMLTLPLDALCELDAERDWFGLLEEVVVDRDAVGRP